MQLTNNRLDRCSVWFIISQIFPCTSLYILSTLSLEIPEGNAKEKKATIQKSLFHFKIRAVLFQIENSD